MKSLNELHIGFIGLGNMGGAVAEGFIRAGIPAGNIYALSLIHISEPTRLISVSRMPSAA